jgi:serine/threonine protein kinase
VEYFDYFRYRWFPRPRNRSPDVRLGGGSCSVTYQITDQNGVQAVKRHNAECDKRTVWYDIQMRLLFDDPLILPVRGLRLKGDNDCLVEIYTDFMEYGSLAVVFDRIFHGSVPAFWIPTNIWKTILGITRSLSAVHSAGGIHGDIQLGSFVISKDGRVCIRNFSPDGVPGLACYQATEIDGDQKKTQKSDIFSYGLVLYEIVTGTRAFPGCPYPPLRNIQNNKEPAHLRQLPQVFRRIIQGCLRRDPTIRPGIDQILDTLEKPNSDGIRAVESCFCHYMNQ